MEESIFSKIVTGEIPSFKVYEDDLTLAFLDINPLSRGHTLVIPKQQVDHLDDCTPEQYAAIFSTVHKVSKILKDKLEPQRVCLAVHGYDIPHAHVHVLPSYTPGDLGFPEASQDKPDFGALEQLAKELQA